MFIIKLIILIAIVMLSSYIGIMITKGYKDRVIELKEVKKGLNIFETKIKFTYEPVPDIFEEISENLKENIAYIFKIASINMRTDTAKQAWIKAIEKSNTSMNMEDLEVLKGLRKAFRKNRFTGTSKSNRVNAKLLRYTN